MNVSFYIAKRYFFAKKGTQSVNIILYISILALAFATTAMFVILSAFSGLEKMNIEMISNVNPEIKITPTSGKSFKNIKNIDKELRQNTNIQAFSKILEEKVYIIYRERQEISFIRGIDKNYFQVFPLDSAITYGERLNFSFDDDMMMGNAIAFKLNMPISETETAQIIVPKAGEGLLQSADEAFTTKELYLKGVFSLQNEKYNNYIYVPIQFVQNLLQQNPESANVIEVKLKNAETRNSVKNQLQQTLGKNVLVQTREQQDASFLKMMNVEKLIIYLICTLIIIITTFNLASAIVIIILDKKQQSQALISLGYTQKELKKLFFYTGILIVSVGAILGILAGVLLVFSQLIFGWYKINPFLAFPVSFQLTNVIITLLTLFVFGILVTFLSSRSVKTQ